jgi:Fe2+ transport system protein FeoA
MPKFWNRLLHGHKRKAPEHQPENPRPGGRRGYGGGGRRHGWQPRPGETVLADCRSGDHVTVSRILGGGPIRRRLLEMGINAGTDVRVVKYAPLKDPIECEIKGYHIALRVAEAQRIIVTPEKAPDEPTPSP